MEKYFYQKSLKCYRKGRKKIWDGLTKSGAGSAVPVAAAGRVRPPAHCFSGSGLGSCCRSWGLCWQGYAGCGSWRGRAVGSWEPSATSPCSAQVSSGDWVPNSWQAQSIRPRHNWGKNQTSGEPSLAPVWSGMLYCFLWIFTSYILTWFL